MVQRWHLSHRATYAASKGAVHNIVRWLSRRAVGRGVMVNGVAPGPVRTAMTAQSTVNAEQLPTGRMAEPDEIAWTIAFLCTPAASYLSGAIVDVNGGALVG
ncbi:SDR family NAD(P)-dependent oxidoreductase [Hydrogenophaga palleronii]|uniref:SDR family NAD(P)-dependent oxidoreductase n=1 Tax=Hydrogenophaga palleronii TaxID=65655 RepID=UPI000A000AD1|nr:SDR family oxidoreductase [Hydrogenophaga palleronii]